LMSKAVLFKCNSSKGNPSCLIVMNALVAHAWPRKVEALI